ncbi:MAG: PHP domain-containing protein [Anaerolineae bacterium]|nr:PHP domain-containing protein [Anaerolineae bacterium]
MIELIANLHIHTTYSDGSKNHAEICRIALKSGLDVVIITDHNVLVKGLPNYYQEGKQRLLLLMGEEIHDRQALKQNNHLLVIGNKRELSASCGELQQIVNAANQDGAATVLAHPYESALPAFNEPAINWEEWDINHFHAIELWNNFSEFKSVINGLADGIFYAFFPEFIAHNPPEAMLKKWDELLRQGKRVAAVGGSDAHALSIKLGLFKKTLFPYEYHFSAINTHLLVPSPLCGDYNTDAPMVINALRQGNCFIGYDLPARTTGFRFSAQGKNQSAIPGDVICLDGGITFQIRLPVPTHCHLIKDGDIINTWHNKGLCTYIVNQPGAYRVECYIDFLGKQRGWIFSNPIYVQLENK